MTIVSVSKAQKKTLLCLAAFAGLGLFCVAPGAHAQSGDMQSRLNRLENEIETLSRAMFKGEEPPAGTFSSSSSDASRAASEVRLNQLETELRSLTGQIEQQNYEIRTLKEQIETLKAQPQGEKLNQMGRPFGTSPLSGSLYGDTATESPPSPPPANNIGYQQVTPPAAAAPGQLGTLPQGQGGKASGGYYVPSDSTNATDVYEQAFTQVRDGHYDQAEIGLTDFLSRFPDHTLAPNARYWLGETYYVRKDYPQAARVFAEAYQKSPKGAKGPDNLLKLGLSLAGMGKTSDACIALKQLRTEYEGIANPVLDRAAREMGTLGCR